MKRQYTQKEIETLLKSMTVVVDTREQVWSHIESGLTKRTIPTSAASWIMGTIPAKIPDLDGKPRDFIG